MNGTGSNRGLRLNPSPTRICLCDMNKTRIHRRSHFRSRRPLFEVLADRALDGVDARRLPACPRTSAGLFSMASRRTSSVCHIEEWEASHQTSLVRLCLRLFSSHKVHRAHSRAPAVCNAQPLCQCCCATRSPHPSVPDGTTAARAAASCILRKRIKRCHR